MLKGVFVEDRGGAEIVADFAAKRLMLVARRLFLRNVTLITIKFVIYTFALLHLHHAEGELQLHAHAARGAVQRLQLNYLESLLLRTGPSLSHLPFISLLV